MGQIRRNLSSKTKGQLRSTSVKPWSVWLRDRKVPGLVLAATGLFIITTLRPNFLEANAHKKKFIF